MYPTNARRSGGVATDPPALEVAHYVRGWLG